jgi:hypothetical protein
MHCVAGIVSLCKRPCTRRALRSGPTRQPRMRLPSSPASACSRSRATPRDFSPTTIPNGSTRCGWARGACDPACRWRRALSGLHRSTTSVPRSSGSPRASGGHGIGTCSRRRPCLRLPPPSGAVIPWLPGSHAYAPALPHGVDWLGRMHAPRSRPHASTGCCLPPVSCARARTLAQSQPRT